MAESDLTGKEFVKEVLGGVERIVSSSDKPKALVVHPHDRTTYDDTSSFQYDSANYRLRYLRQEEESYKLTLTLVNARIGRSDLDKRLEYFTKDNPGERVNFGEISHDGENFVVPLLVFSRYSPEKLSHIVLYLVQYLLGRRPVLERKKEEEKRKKEGQQKKGGARFASNGPSKF